MAEGAGQRISRESKLTRYLQYCERTAARDDPSRGLDTAATGGPSLLFCLDPI